MFFDTLPERAKAMQASPEVFLNLMPSERVLNGTAAFLKSTLVVQLLIFNKKALIL
jgi:hypothetical protein